MVHFILKMKNNLEYGALHHIGSPYFIPSQVGLKYMLLWLKIFISGQSAGFHEISVNAVYVYLGSAS